MGDQMDLSNIDANSLTPAVDDDFDWHSGPFVPGELRGNSRCQEISYWVTLMV